MMEKLRFVILAFLFIGAGILLLGLVDWFMNNLRGSASKLT